jgi:hypothetical protein
MNASYYLASISYLMNTQLPSVLASAGISQAHLDLLKSETPWTNDKRVTVRQTLDTLVYGLCDLSGLARVDVPAQIVAAVVATIVTPANWFAVSQWLSGIKPARDLSDAEQSVEIERLTGGQMLHEIMRARATLDGSDVYAQYVSEINARLKIGSVK